MLKYLKIAITKIFGKLPLYIYMDLRNKYFLSNARKNTVKENKLKEEERIIFYSSFVNEGDLCFDIGANLGNRIEPLLKIGARVVAVEPQKDCVNYLKYKFRKSIDIVPKGLAEKKGTAELHIADGSTISSFSKEWIREVKEKRFKNNKWEKKATIEMTTLDDIIFKYGYPNFIKIDVEGYELEVLKGLTKPFDYLSFEYTMPEFTHRLIKCINEIEKHEIDYIYNFAYGEEMSFVLVNWVSSKELIEKIQKGELTYGFGDIYVKRANL